MDLIDHFQAIADGLSENFNPPSWGTWEEIVCEFPRGEGCPDYLSGRYRMPRVKAQAVLRFIREAQR